MLFVLVLLKCQAGENRLGPAIRRGNWFFAGGSQCPKHHRFDARVFVEHGQCGALKPGLGAYKANAAVHQLFYGFS